MPTGNLQQKGRWILITDFLKETDLIHTKKYQSKESSEHYKTLIEEKYLAFLRKIIKNLNNATPNNSSEVRSYMLAYAQTLQRRYKLPTADINWIKSHLAYVSTENVSEYQIKHINEDIWWNFPRGTDRYRFIYERFDKHLDMIYPKKCEQVLDYADWIFQTKGAMTIDY